MEDWIVFKPLQFISHLIDGDFAGFFESFEV
jgi:hypothetical protein